MATSTGATEGDRHEATFVLAIDRGRSKLFRKYQRGISGNVGGIWKSSRRNHQRPISITPATSNEWKLSEVKVIEVDLTTEDIESDQEVCAIELPKTLSKP